MSEDKSDYDVARFFQAAIKRNASDLIFTAGVSPCLRLNGELCPFDLPPLTPEQSLKLVYSVLTQNQIARLEAESELDFSIQFMEYGRFRGNAYYQKGTIAGVFRLIPSEIPHFSTLGLPPILEELVLQPQGLLLFTGPTGHGKSTTQASLIDIVNQKKRKHIITVEDPIEFLFTSKNSVIDQREIGQDTNSFAQALKHVLRQDPDVILIGEMRDLETTSAALTAAETGHLVMGTLHTNSAIQAVDRIIDMFPPYQQNQVRTQLSFSLLAIFAQRLLPRTDKKGRVAASELVRNTSAVSNLIREGKTSHIASVIETHSKLGMITMDASLKKLYQQGLVTRETAAGYMTNPDALAAVGMDT